MGSTSISVIDQRSGGEAVQRRPIYAVKSPEGPWAKVAGPLRQHSRLSERSYRIYKATRITPDDEQRLRELYTK